MTVKSPPPGGISAGYKLVGLGGTFAAAIIGFTLGGWALDGWLGLTPLFYNLTGVFFGVGLVFVYATLGGMRGITYTQVAQYGVLILAYLIPAVAISLKMTGNPIPQLGFGSTMIEGENAGLYLLETIDRIHRDLGFPEYTAAFVEGNK